MRKSFCIAFGMLVLSAADVSGQTTATFAGPMESYPEGLQARIEVIDRELAALVPSSIGAYAPSYVVAQLRRWSPGQTVRVAFNGGSYELRRDIADAALEWTRYANIKLDFGHDSNRQTFREWTTSDKIYAAEIRIGFTEKGYWSLVGTDSNNREIAGPAEASMNFQGFHLRTPTSWRGTTLHEFGHALGFEHEHQHPLGGCEAEFRWHDDPGYQLTRNDENAYVSDKAGKRPGVYTVLAGFPNRWSAATVDFNLRQLKSSSAYSTSQFDPQSIMKYYFDGWMYVAGEKSRCYTSARNESLSPMDRIGANNAYPSDQAAVLSIAARRDKFTKAISVNRFLSQPAQAYLRNQATNADLKF